MFLSASTYTVAKETLPFDPFFNTNYSAWMADREPSICTFLSSGLIWAISMAMLLVFHTQEWLVKYSKTIMDLWRRVIVFIILRLTNGHGRITMKEGMERREMETMRWEAPGNNMPAKEKKQAMQRRKVVGWRTIWKKRWRGVAFKRRFSEIRDFLELKFN